MRNSQFWDHSDFSPLRERHRFSQGSGSVEATQQHAAKARLTEELTFHSNIWQMINSDYHPVELGLAKPVIYTRLSHLVHSGKCSETWRIQGAKLHPLGWLHTGGDREGQRASPSPCDSWFSWCSHQNAVAKQPQAGPCSPFNC